jgi:hypothetical protein
MVVVEGEVVSGLVELLAAAGEGLDEVGEGNEGSELE